MAKTTAGQIPEPRKSKLIRAGFWSEAIVIAEHTTAFVAAILSIWLVHLLLVKLLGPDARFYDVIPIRYVIDTGHLAAFARFIWKIVTNIWSR